MEQPAVIGDPLEVDARLAALGLSVDILEQAILFGDYEARKCTANDPSNLAGILRWGRTLRRLCELLTPHPHGWRRDEHLNYPTVVHPSGSFGIAVQTGDEFTADPSATPSTRYRRGRVTREAVARNAQLLLFNQHLQPFPEVGEISRDSRITWLLLVSVESDVIHAELSWPQAIGLDGRPIAYHERILLPPIDRGDTVGRIDQTPTEFNVDVRRHGEA